MKFERSALEEQSRQREAASKRKDFSGLEGCPDSSFHDTHQLAEKANQFAKNQ